MQQLGEGLGAFERQHLQDVRLQVVALRPSTARRARARPDRPWWRRGRRSRAGRASDAAARSRRGRGPRSAAWRRNGSVSSTLRPSRRVDQQAVAVRCARGRNCRPRCAVMSARASMIVLDRGDLLAQLARLRVARGERLLELALEAEVARVEHHRVDVAEDRVEVVVAEDVQLAGRAASGRRDRGATFDRSDRRRRGLVGCAPLRAGGLQLLGLVVELRRQHVARSCASISWLARSRPVIASLA